MGTVQPKGEKIRQAVRWISENRIEDESRPLYLLIQEAAQKFNLSPKDEDFLMSFYQENKI